MVGDPSLSAEPPVWMDDLLVYPHIDTHSATVKGTIGNVTGASGTGDVHFFAEGKDAASMAVSWTTNGGSFSDDISLGNEAPLWDEFHPELLHLTARLRGAERRVTFGLREISTQGTQFAINGQRTFFRGTLECCIFPKTGHPPTDVASWKRIIMIAARQLLRSGGNVLLTIPGPQVQNFDPAPVKLGFSSIFWNTSWTGRQAPSTLGILCDPQHPALAKFPTDFRGNWQWWYLIHGAGALRLDLLPREVKPIVRVIDDGVTARPLALIAEGRVGAGKIIVCGFDLTRGLETNPVARQMRESLMACMDSKKFKPVTSISESQIDSLIGPGAEN